MGSKVVTLGGLTGLLGSVVAGWYFFSVSQDVEPLLPQVVSMTGNSGDPVGGERNRQSASTRPVTIVDPVPRIEFEAPWRSGFRFTSEDDEPDRRWDFDPFDVLADLPGLLERAGRGDPEAAYALYQTARACDDKLQSRLIAEYNEALAQRGVELNRATPQQRLSWLMQASDAVVPTAPMRALFVLERLPSSDPQRATLGVRVTEALEKAVTQHGRLEDVIALARAFSQGDPVAQDLRKAVAYYQIAAESLGGGNSYAATAADLRLSLRGADLADIRQMQARIFKERQQALKDNPLPGVTLPGTG